MSLNSILIPGFKVIAVALMLVHTACKSTKKEPLPELITIEISNVTPSTAQSGGSITSDGGFEIVARGICWGTRRNPTIRDNFTSDGAGMGSFTSELTGLSVGPTYFIRAYATTERGTAYGNEIEYTNLTGKIGSVSDIDGNTYKTIGIGTQVWMAENLKVTRYHTGKYLSYPGRYDGIWSSISTGAYAWFDNEEIWKNVYGALYNWSAVNDSAGLCPEGWHVPTDEEWDQLLNYIAVEQKSAGALLKSCRQVNSTVSSECNTTEHPRWDAHAIQHGTDDYQFSGLPGGFRLYDGFFPTFLGSNSQWWTSTQSEADPGKAIARGMNYQSSNLFRDVFNKKFGFSVRCVKD